MDTSKYIRIQGFQLQKFAQTRKELLNYLSIDIIYLLNEPPEIPAWIIQLAATKQEFH